MGRSNLFGPSTLGTDFGRLPDLTTPLPLDYVRYWRELAALKRSTGAFQIPVVLPELPVVNSLGH